MTPMLKPDARQLSPTERPAARCRKFVCRAEGATSAEAMRMLVIRPKMERTEERIMGRRSVVGLEWWGRGNKNGGGTANHVLWLHDTDCGDSDATFGHAVCGADVGEDDCTAAAHCPEEGLEV
ncbi:hypothetical protein BHYA_0109g00390 [Botrytis hyacinthi]|uniref:Uncharacterized protein n=1 Tax=Botrytis hyacinthi TaxID=278943 RepID=A0A4Z1GNG2_9HELO|nr:hypothetical protein BHYA_0109g00390 [Botrytis hyacinthi]